MINMKNLKRVTITGADDNTLLSDILAVSKEYPFVEWGILVYDKYEIKSSDRFPSKDWIKSFSELVKENKLNVSMHLCGGYVDSLLLGNDVFRIFNKLEFLFSVAQRIQINTHGEVYRTKSDFFHVLKTYPTKEFVFQLDKINNHYYRAAREINVNCSGLFDYSHGAGVLPDIWPSLIDDRAPWVGYSGGIGSDNVYDCIQEIQKVTYQDYWIDMETRVRTNHKLDMNKVGSVLNTCEAYIS